METKTMANIQTLTVHYFYEKRIWKAYCAWSAVGRDQDKLGDIALEYDVTPYAIEDCHFDHTADRD